MFQCVKRIFLTLVMGLAMGMATWLALPGSISQTSVKAAQLNPGLRFVNGTGAPIVGRIRVLCYEDSDGNVKGDDLFIETYGNGVPTPATQLPLNCNYVAALHLKYEQPSGKPGHEPAYGVYATSWAPGTRSLQPTDRDVRISDGWPLVLFNVVASVAWNVEVSYLQQLEAGMQDASAYLYDLTDGRMAFGSVRIFKAGENWNGADLRILAANDYRPAAYVGGIVPKPIEYHSPVTNVIFAPSSAEIYFGRHWNGFDASNAITGTWSQTAAYRTIVHEWAHYALFLYDEYQQTTGQKSYCICNELDRVTSQPGVCGGVTTDLAASAMAYQYIATELWDSTVHTQSITACQGTPQWKVHGHSDWETLAAWFEIQGLTQGADLPSWNPPSGVLAPGPPLGLLNDVISISIPSSSSPSGITVEVSISDTLGLTETVQSQVYVLEGDSEKPDRILHQGKPISVSIPSSQSLLGEIELLGEDTPDNIRVFVDRHDLNGNPGRYAFRGPGPGPQDVTAIRDNWQADLNASYALSGSLVTTMTIVLTSSNTVSEPLIAQLCIPDADIGCHNSWREAMTEGPSTVWTATMTPLPDSDQLPRYGIIRVTASGVGASQEPGELIRWFQVGGTVPPAHNGGGTPLVDGLVTLSLNDASSGSSACNKFFFMPATNFGALTEPIPNEEEFEFQGIIATPLDLDLMLPQNGNCTIFDSGDKLPDGISATLTMYYPEDEVKRLVARDQGVTELLFNIDEATLQIIHYDPVIGTWIPMPTAGQDETLNWISTNVMTQTGIYAIAWQQEE